MNHSSISCLHIDHSSPSPTMNGFELDPLRSHLFQDLTPSKTTSIFLICLSHLLGWHTGPFLEKKKKSFDDIFSKKHPYREWRMEIPPMYNWSSDDKLISLILPVALELCRVQTNCSIKRHTNNTPRFPHCFDDFSWIWTFMSVSLNEIDLLHILPVLRKKPKLQTHTRNIIQSEETWYSRWNCS